MISNTDLFYCKTKEFEEKRNYLISEFESAKKRIRGYEGSSRHSIEQKKIEDDFESKLKSLQSEYRHSFSVIFNAMTDAIERRTIPAISTENLNMLNALKMKKNISLDELLRVARTMKDNPVCIDVLQDIANEHDIRHSFSDYCSEMSTKKAHTAIATARKRTDDFLKYTTTKAARLVRQHRERLYGKLDNPTPLAKRQPFECKEHVFSELFMLNKDGLDKFANIVDANGDANG